MADRNHSIDLICFGGEDWWYHNRGHIDMQLIRRFARRGKVLYVNSIVMQRTNRRIRRNLLKKIIRKTKSILTGLRKTEAGFWVYSPFVPPVHSEGWCGTLNQLMLKLQVLAVAKYLGLKKPLIWVACPTAYKTALSIRKSKLIYQKTDRYEESPNVDRTLIQYYDRKLREEADLTIYVNTALYREEAPGCKKAFYLDHGVDYELFADAAGDSFVPQDIAHVKKPIVGYFGGLADHKVDIDLLEKAVCALPDYSFVFVGDYGQHHKQRLSCYNNVWLLGKKPYEQIPHYGKCFDVAIMPLVRNLWIQACNPIKLKEYLALGKPVVAMSSFSEADNYIGFISCANSTEEFVSFVKQAISTDNPEKTALRRKRVKPHTWDAKAEQILREILPE